MTLRPALLAVAALATALGIFLALCGWGAGGNRDLAAVTREFRRGEELEAQAEASRRRFEAKRDLATQVLAGRMTLLEAAKHFRRLDEADPVSPPGTRRPPVDEAVECDWVLHLVWEHFKLQGRYAAAARWYAEAFAGRGTSRPEGLRAEGFRLPRGSRCFGPARWPP
jgi:hypothetical protein